MMAILHLSKSSNITVSGTTSLYFEIASSSVPSAAVKEATTIRYFTLKTIHHNPRESFQSTKTSQGKEMTTVFNMSTNEKGLYRSRHVL